MYLISERRLPGSIATSVSSTPTPSAARLAERGTSSGMALASGWPTYTALMLLLRVDLRLERKDAQHEVGRAADLVDPLAAPGPDRRADEMDRLHSRGLELDLDAEVEVGRVDADEGIGPGGEQALDEPAADRQDLAQVAEHLGIAAHRELVVRPPGGKAAARPCAGRRSLRRRARASARAGWPAASPRAGRPRPRPRPSRSAGRQESSTHGNAQRAMPRRAEARKSPTRRASSAASGIDSASAAIRARASSSVRPSR